MAALASRSHGRLHNEWCSRMESNHRPPPYQGGALPTELRERVFRQSSLTAKHSPASCRTLEQELLNGAGDGNRTRTSSLEGYSSTIELLPRRTNLLGCRHRAFGALRT